MKNVGCRLVIIAPLILFLYFFSQPLSFFREKARKNGPCGAASAKFIDIRFQVSGFGCQEKESPNPDNLNTVT
jgi:hypothetical protein